jgi:hypothetical protein
MEHYPTTAAEVEDGYRRARTAAQLRAAGGRSRRSGRGLTSRVRWHRRRDEVAR